MKRSITFWLVVAVVLAAMGANPRYIEELAIGGGFGDAVDGGANFDKTGAITTNGAISTLGNVAAGANDASNHSVSVTSGSASSSGVALNQGDANNGGNLLFDGPSGKLVLGTRNGSSAISQALEIAKGSQNPASVGDFTVKGNDLNFGGGASIRDQNTGALGFQAAAGKDLSWYVGANRYLLLSSSWFYPEAASITLGRWDFRWSTLYAQALDVSGDGTLAGGDLGLGADSTTRGVLTLWDGSGGSAPGSIKIASPNGTVWYLFVEDDGTLKVHNALPTANGNGQVVGLQF